MPKARTIPHRIKIPTKKSIRKHLCKDAQLNALRSGFELIPDHRRGGSKISLPDVLMSGFAVFDLKDPSLLAFDNRRIAKAGNMEQIYGVTQVACDTQMRTVLDPVDPELLRVNFRTVTAQLQRSKVLKQFAFYKGCYLLSLDGTGSYSSNKVTSDSCMVKNHSNGTKTYYKQVLGAVLVHPDNPVVIPFAPEMIIIQDGATKNDCERNASKRFLDKFRVDYPRLPVIIIEDGLSSNGPHITDIQNRWPRKKF
jgi:hypothetical protein